MKTLDCTKLDVVNPTRSNLFGWRGQFTPDSKPVEFEGFGNCGEFAAIKIQTAEKMESGSNPVEFDGIKNFSELRWAV